MRKIIAIIIICLSASASFANNLGNALSQSAAGMHSQSARMKVISQNIANANSTGSTPGAKPYRRKTITFKNVSNKETGATIVTVDKISQDYKAKFKAKFDPAHPAADEKGYVLLPNVNTSIETLDMKEAQRSYEANLGAMETSKKMIEGTIDLLR